MHRPRFGESPPSDGAQGNHAFENRKNTRVSIFDNFYILLNHDPSDRCFLFLFFFLIQYNYTFETFGENIFVKITAKSIRHS